MYRYLPLVPPLSQWVLSKESTYWDYSRFPHLSERTPKSVVDNKNGWDFYKEEDYCDRVNRKGVGPEVGVPNPPPLRERGIGPNRILDPDRSHQVGTGITDQ